MRYFIMGLVFFVFLGCATTPPEFITSMEKERDGINLLRIRHQQTVRELTDNWYQGRVAHLMYIKGVELDKISFMIIEEEVVRRAQLAKLEVQFTESLEMTAKIRDLLIEGYSDLDNWDKLVKLNSINLEMVKSLTELSSAQRAFYADLVGNNTPFPTDFINDQTKKFLGQ